MAEGTSENLKYKTGTTPSTSNSVSNDVETDSVPSSDLKRLPIQDENMGQTARPVQTLENFQEYVEWMPVVLKQGNIDAVIINSEEDQEEALKFKEHILKNVSIKFQKKQYPPVINLLSEIQLDQIEVNNLEAVMEKTTYIFLFLTKSFCDDELAKLLSNACLMETIQNKDKKWCIVPVHTRSKRYRDYREGLVLRSFQSLKYWSNDKLYLQNLATLFEQKIAERFKRNYNLRIERKNYFEKHRDEIMKAASILAECEDCFSTSLVSQETKSDDEDSISLHSKKKSNDSEKMSLDELSLPQSVSSLDSSTTGGTIRQSTLQICGPAEPSDLCANDTLEGHTKSSKGFVSIHSNSEDNSQESCHNTQYHHPCSENKTQFSYPKSSHTQQERLQTLPALPSSFTEADHPAYLLSANLHLQEQSPLDQQDKGQSLSNVSAISCTSGSAFSSISSSMQAQFGETHSFGSLDSNKHSTDNFIPIHQDSRETQNKYFFVGDNHSHQQLKHEREMETSSTECLKLEQQNTSGTNGACMLVQQSREALRERPATNSPQPSQQATPISEIESLSVKNHEPRNTHDDEERPKSFCKDNSVFAATSSDEVTSPHPGRSSSNSSHNPDSSPVKRSQYSGSEKFTISTQSGQVIEIVNAKYIMIGDGNTMKVNHGGDATNPSSSSDEGASDSNGSEERSETNLKSEQEASQLLGNQDNYHKSPTQTLVKNVDSSPLGFPDCPGPCS